MKIFHHCDPDGWCSAAIVYKWEKEQGTEGIKCISINYPEKIDVSKIKDKEQVYIVDYSVSPENMDELLTKTHSIVWIDHHITAIEKYENYDKKIEGIRDIRDAACELTWKYFFPARPMPLSVELIGDYDNWKWNRGDMTREFISGVKLIGSNPKSDKWQFLIEQDNSITQDLLIQGKAIDQYVTMDNKSACRKAYEVTFEGYKCIALNARGKSSLTFSSIDNGDYDILIVWNYGKSKSGKLYTVSLYTGKDKDIDVSQICKKYGGGGHAGASGMTLSIEDMLQTKIIG